MPAAWRQGGLHARRVRTRHQHAAGETEGLEPPACLDGEQLRIARVSAERAQPGEPAVAPDDDGAARAVGDDQRHRPGVLRHEVEHRQRREVDPARPQAGLGEAREMRVEMRATHGDRENGRAARDARDRSHRHDGILRRQRKLAEELERRGARQAGALAEGERQQAVRAPGHRQHAEDRAGAVHGEVGERAPERLRAAVQRDPVEPMHAHQPEAALAACDTELVPGDLDGEQAHGYSPLPSGSTTRV